MDFLRVTFSPAESRDIDELLEEIHELYDPNTSASGNWSTPSAPVLLERIEGGSIDRDEPRAFITDLLAEDIIERREDDLPEDPKPDDVLPLAIELSERLDSLATDDQDGFMARAFCVRAVQDWKQFGLLAFCEWWLD